MRPKISSCCPLRGAGGWSSQDIATGDRYEKAAIPGRPAEYEAFSPDLALALVTPYYAFGATPPPLLAPGVSGEEAYLRDDQPIAPEASERQSYEEAQANSAFLAPGYLALFASGDDKEEAFQGATADLSHIVFDSSVPLTGEGGAGLYERSVGSGAVYVSELPEGKGPAQGSLGYDGKIVAHAISGDGTRVMWGTSNGRLYLTDTATTPVQTIRLDAAQGVVEPGKAEAVFQTAAVDGSRVFFTDNQALTKGATTGGAEQHADLYECEIVEEAGQLKCVLRDLTSGVAKAGEHAAVQELLLGASEDGQSVYLVAQGVLAANANERGETAGAGEENLYELHEEDGKWATRFIATLSSSDSAGWGSKEAGQVHLTARVSPDGRYLAFMSERELTGYDNVDVNPAAGGAHDEEVFLYDSQTQRLTCVSCDPTGARPRGVV